MTRKNILLAGIYHETNVFIDGLTRIDDFTILKGSQLLKFVGENSPLGGFLEVANLNNWDIIPIVDMRAMPGPLVDDEVVTFFLKEFMQIVNSIKKHIDGIYLILHGAMVSETIDDVEGYILEKIKQVKRFERIPICGVVDLHANFTSKMAKFSDGLIAYTKNPHEDAKETAIKATNLLDEIINKNLSILTIWEHPSIMWPPTGTATSDEPMLSLERLARELESKNKDFLSVNVLAGFAFADIPDTGISFTIVTKNISENKAKKKIKTLSELAIKLRETGIRKFLSIENVLENIDISSEGPVIIVEPSDNIGGGTSGDYTEVLRSLIKKNIKNTIAILNKPELVKKLTSKNIGEKIRVDLSKKTVKYKEKPLKLQVKIISRSNGKFTLENRRSHLSSMLGQNIDMGPCVVIKNNGTKILLTSKKTPPFDLGQLRSQGIIPEKQSVILVKAAVAHRQAYDPIAYKSYTVESLGPATNELNKLYYKKIKRPIFPLDQGIF